MDQWTEYVSCELDGPLLRALWDRRHDWGAERVRKMILELGGFYLKAEPVWSIGPFSGPFRFGPLVRSLVPSSVRSFVHSPHAG